MNLNDPAEAIEICLAAGVSEFVVCGGARNVELVAQLSELPDPVRIWNHPEERSAAFFALGRSRASGRPAAVVTTSGTAAAELLPAAIEAHYQCVPLLLLTADRPERYRGSGAPQAIEQEGLFGAYAETCATKWRRDRPLHLNVRLEEPTAERIAARPPSLPTTRSSAPVPPASGTAEAKAFLHRGGSLTVMVGCLPPHWRAAVRSFLIKLAVPVYAEATSGLREDSALRRGAAPSDRVLRIGGVPSCRAWRDLEDSPEVEVFSIAPNGLPGLARESGVVRAVEWEALEVQRIENPAEVRQDARDLLEKYPRAEAAWIRNLSEAVPEGSLVFLGNSLPIREWNQFATDSDRGLRCVANRGANGIDGTVSTFLGMAEGEEEAWLVVGDLASLYDLAGPWVLPQLAPSRLRIVVINNGGGKIFRRLPALQSAPERARAAIENPHSIRFESWAALWDIEYRACPSPNALHELPDHPVVIEIVPDNWETESFWEALESR